REDERPRVAEKAYLVGAADLADELDVGSAEQRTNRVLEVLGVDAIDLGRDLEWHADGGRDANRRLDALLGRDASEKREVAAVSATEGVTRGRHAVVHGGAPVGVGERPSLGVADRDQCGLGIR